MSTPSERLEATVWLDATYPDLPTEQRANFYTAVDEYYEQHPIADRCPHTLAILKQDDHAFAEILRSIRADQHPALPNADATPSTDES